jgi:hypothetical protein
MPLSAIFHLYHEQLIKHQKFKFKLQQKIHNVPVIKQKHATKKGPGWFNELGVFFAVI